MAIVHNQVVLVVIAVALSLTVFLVMGQIHNITDATTDKACRTAVLSKVALRELQPTSAADISLPGCGTRAKTFTSRDKPDDIASAIAKDAIWCHNSFASWSSDEAPLVSGSETLCHVCAIYSHEDRVIVPGVLDEIHFLSGGVLDPREPTSEEVDVGAVARTLQEIRQKYGTDWQLVDTLPASDVVSISYDQPLAVLFMQETAEQKTFLGSLLGSPQSTSDAAFRTALASDLAAAGVVIVASGGTGTVAVALRQIGKFAVRRLVLTSTVGAALGSQLYVGGYLGGTEVVASGIIIKPFDENVVNELGCTRSDLASS